MLKTHLVVHTVTGISADDTATGRLDDLLDLVSNLAIGDSGLANGNSLVHRFLCNGDQIRRFLVDFANRVCGVQITVEAAVDWD